MDKKQILTFENPYRLLSAENKLNFKEHNYCDLFTIGLMNMFEYEKSEEYDLIDDATIELSLISNGSNGFWKNTDNKVVCGFGYGGGALDENGVGTLITGNLLNGKGYKGTNGIDAVLGWNNSLRVPDRVIAKYSDYLTECDISEECVVRNSRQAPIITAKNSKIKTVLEQILKRIFKGEPMTITDDGFSISNDNKMIEVVNLTEPNNIDKLHYLSQYHTDILKRLFSIYGQALGEGSGTKLAQQSVAEVTANVSSSFVIPLDRLKQRQKMCKELEKVFGGSIKVRFSDAWRVEFEKWALGRSETAEDNIFDNDEIEKEEGVEDEND